MKKPVLVRPLVEKLHPYTPGEQPRIKGLIKLNTNENPYPPSPKVLRAVREAVDGRLRLYPDPTADALRDKLAALHGCRRENIIVGNGSDEILALAIRALVEPSDAIPARVHPERSRVQFFDPSYSLYPVLAAIHGAQSHPIQLEPGFALPDLRELRHGKQWDSLAALTLITTPNAPGGRGYRTAELETLCQAQKGVVLLDEAYVDFAEENAMELALRLPHVLVARTFSKAYSLCFQRVGYAVGSEVLIGALHKIRDSYNVNGLGQVAALATLSDLPYYRANFRRIIRTRQRLTQALQALKFRVVPSQTNFILATPPILEAREWLERLRDRRILVRWFNRPPVADCLRITIGTEAEADQLINSCQAILAELDQDHPKTLPVLS